MNANDPPVWAMFIDDDPVDQMLYQRIATRAHANLRITPFFYADEALAELHKDVENLPDLIFLDLNIPRMSGLEFLAELANFDQEVLNQLHIIVASTSINSADDRAVAQYPMVKGVVTKPVTAEQLEALLNQLPTSRPGDPGERQ